MQGLIGVCLTQKKKRSSLLCRLNGLRCGPLWFSLEGTGIDIDSTPIHQALCLPSSDSHFKKKVNQMNLPDVSLCILDGSHILIFFLILIWINWLPFKPEFILKRDFYRWYIDIHLWVNIKNVYISKSIFKSKLILELSKKFRKITLQRKKRLTAAQLLNFK